jgi:hypothetical protein
MKPVLVCFLAFVSLSAGQRQQTFTGTITDDMCAMVGHASMRMGPTDAECTEACVMAHGALYVLNRDTAVWGLSDQKKPAEFAGMNVRVVGTLDEKTKIITVSSITAAPK